MSESNPSSVTAGRHLDSWAIGLSGLCLVHCVALPIVASLLPVLGTWARADWVHVLFVALAAPLSALALLGQAEAAGSRPGVVALAAIGVTLLGAGALVVGPGLETPVTVAGSLCLAAAHIWNWRRRRRNAHRPAERQAA